MVMAVLEAEMWEEVVGAAGGVEKAEVGLALDMLVAEEQEEVAEVVVVMVAVAVAAAQQVVEA